MEAMMYQFATADQLRLRLSRFAGAALIAASVLAGLVLPAHADCAENERKSVVGPHLSPAVQLGFADQEHPLVFCNLQPGQKVKVTSLLMSASKKFFSSVAEFQISDGQ